MQYSPKLKRVMQEIEAILEKEDLAGLIVIHTTANKYMDSTGAANAKGFTEFLYKIDPSYSAAKIDNGHFQVKGKAEHYSSKEDRDMQLAATVNMFESLSEVSSKLSLQFIEMQNMVGSIVKRDESEDDGSYSSHTTQNN